MENIRKKPALQEISSCSAQSAGGVSCSQNGLENWLSSLSGLQVLGIHSKGADMIQVQKVEKNGDFILSVCERSSSWEGHEMPLGGEDILQSNGVDSHPFFFLCSPKVAS